MKFNRYLDGINVISSNSSEIDACGYFEEKVLNALKSLKTIIFFYFLKFTLFKHATCVSFIKIQQDQRARTCVPACSHKSMHQETIHVRLTLRRPALDSLSNLSFRPYYDTLRTD